jgi:signal transduction histidine kinase
VQAQLSSNEGTLLIEVEDNGVGFSSASDLTSIGLKSLQTRVAALGGTIAFESRKNGLSVNVELAISARKRK